RAALAAPLPESLQILSELVTDSLLTDTDRIEAIKRLGQSKDEKAVTALISALNRSEEVRVAAANALASIGPPEAQAAQGKLLELAQSSSDPLPYLWALTALGQKDAADRVLEAIPKGVLSSIPSYRPELLAQAIGPEQLIVHLSNREPRIRQFAAEWLGPLCVPSAVAPIEKAASDEDRNVRLAALVALARCGSEEALSALDRQIPRDPSLWPSLQNALLAESGAPGMGVLINHIENTEQRSQLLTLLSSIFDPRSGDVFLRELERRPVADEQLKLEIASALAEIGDERAIELLEPLIKQGKVQVAGAAIEAVGKLGKAHPTLEAMLNEIANRRSELRPVALQALADFGACGDSTKATYRRFAKSDPPALQGLARCGEAIAIEIARARLSQPMPRRGQTRVEEGEAWLAALEAVALSKAAELAPRLLELASDPDGDPTLRGHAAAVLGEVGDNSTLEKAADRLLDPSTPSGVRRAILRALRRNTPRSVLSRMMGYVRGGEDEERSWLAAIVVGEGGGSEEYRELAALLKDARASRHAAFALSLGGDDAARKALSQALASSTALVQELSHKLNETEQEISRTHLLARITHAAKLREQGFGLPFERLSQAMRASERGPATPSARELRREMAQLLDDEDPKRRQAAAHALLALGAKGILLARRAKGGPGAKEASLALGSFSQ
ncbi:MAG: HEAT repeat domain-containing protein, partial [Sandaracinaceae bacterium]|nr:HEAT repeat domain-containing protein [Sandaracinaceae bacterium]